MVALGRCGIGSFISLSQVRRRSHRRYSRPGATRYFHFSVGGRHSRHVSNVHIWQTGFEDGTTSKINVALDGRRNNKWVWRLDAFYKLAADKFAGRKLDNSSNLEPKRR